LCYVSLSLFAAFNGAALHGNAKVVSVYWSVCSEATKMDSIWPRFESKKEQKEERVKYEQFTGDDQNGAAEEEPLEEVGEEMMQNVDMFGCYQSAAMAVMKDI